MRKFFRLSAYFVLFTFFVSLGDWPFLDELLAEEAAQQQVASIPTPQANEAASKAPQVQHGFAGLYQALSNFVDMPAHHFPIVGAAGIRHVAAQAPPYTSADSEPFERPPKLLLI